MMRTLSKRLFVTTTLAGAVLVLAASNGMAARARSSSLADGRLQQTLNVSKASAAEIEVLLGKSQLSRETAGILVQLVLSHDGSAFAGKRHSGGGWCWNEDGSFYGSLPCPKEIVNRDRTGAAQAKAMPRPGAQPLTLRSGQVSRAVASDIDAMLDRASYSKETAGLLVQLVLNQQGGKFPGYRKGGGWCWNDNGTFHGSLPCPK